MPCVRKHIIIYNRKIQIFNKHYPGFLQIAKLYLAKSNQKAMKLFILFLSAIAAFASNATAQDIKVQNVPAVVKDVLAKKYPNAAKVGWEKEKGNYEANWGGKSGEDTSVQFTPAGAFVEEVDAIPVSQLPRAVATYVKAHYNGAKVKEAGKVTDATGNHLFEAEIKGNDLIFDKNGKLVKKD